MQVFKISLYIFFLSFFINGCSSGSEEFFKVNLVSNNWSARTVQSFEFEIKDIAKPKDIAFILLNNDDYPYSNIFLIVSMQKQGSSKKETDTLNYALAKRNGDWIGTGFGRIKEIRLGYRRSFLFPQEGKYIFEIRHGMRKDPLPGIENIGVIIKSLNF